MGSIVVAAALAAAAGGEPEPAVVPAGFFPGAGGAWSGTSTFYHPGRETTYGTGIGPEVYSPRSAQYGPDGRRYDSRAPFSPSPYDQPARGRVGGVIGGGVYLGGASGGGFGGGLFRRR